MFLTSYLLSLLTLRHYLVHTIKWLRMRLIAVTYELYAALGKIGPEYIRAFPVIGGILPCGEPRATSELGEEQSVT